MKWFQMAGVLASLVSLAGCAIAQSGSIPTDAGSTVQAKRHAQGFLDLQGRAVSLDNYKGRPVVLSFLAPSDRDSQAQVPLLLRLAGAYQSEGVVFLVAGEHASAQALEEFARGLTFPIWQDPQARELKQRGFSAVPAHQFIDRQGRVASSRQGFLSRGELLENLSLIHP